MFLSLLSHILCAWFAFALPAYATYKALAQAPSPDTLQTIATYWAVVGLFVAFEQTLGLFLSWLPFYWELRTIFLLYVSLPQTQGSTYVYNTFLEPWLARNEADLDASLTSAQSNALAFCRSRIAALFDLVSGLLNGSQSIPDADTNTSVRPADQLKGLWTAYGPSVLAAFAPKSTKNDADVNGSVPGDTHDGYSIN